MPGGGRRQAVELRGRRRRRRGQGQGKGVRRWRLQGRPAPVPAPARRGEAISSYRALDREGFLTLLVLVCSLFCRIALWLFIRLRWCGLTRR